MLAPAAVYCEGGNVWTVGSGGAARLGSEGWRVIGELPGKLGLVTGRGAEEIWIAGDRGVFRGMPR